MSTKTNPFIERAPAIRAIAECGALLRELNDGVLLPTKQYGRASEARKERWLQLAQLAEAQAAKATAPAPVKVRKPRSSASVSVPIAQGDTGDKPAIVA